MGEGVVADEIGRLRSFAATGSAEEEDYCYFCGGEAGAVAVAGGGGGRHFGG